MQPRFGDHVALLLPQHRGAGRGEDALEEVADGESGLTIFTFEYFATYFHISSCQPGLIMEILRFAHFAEATYNEIL